MFKQWVIGVCLTILLCLSVTGVHADSFDADIRRLLVMTGAGEEGMQVMTEMIRSYDQLGLSVPDDFWDRFKAEISEEDLINLVVPIYKKYLNHQDILALLAFYESDAGQRFLNAMPAISRDSMKAGEKWGEALGEKVLKQMRAEGILKE